MAEGDIGGRSNGSLGGGRWEELDKLVQNLKENIFKLTKASNKAPIIEGNLDKRIKI